MDESQEDVLTKATEVAVYEWGLCFLSACCAIDDVEKITRRVNMLHPTGISSEWKLHEGLFRTGETNPCQCNKYPNRKHYLFSC